MLPFSTNATPVFFGIACMICILLACENSAANQLLKKIYYVCYHKSHHTDVSSIHNYLFDYFLKTGTNNLIWVRFQLSSEKQHMSFDVITQILLT